jgi:mannose-6-phosphate isomerase-like protein (cupin superfamily)
MYERNEKGEVKGVRRVADALKKHGVRLGNRVITSQDKGMDAAQRDLKRAGSPPGVEQWQIPIVLGADKNIQDILCFVSRMEPGAKVPEHSHNHGLLRIVIEGTLKYRDLELKPGDWMLVPKGVSYSVEAGARGCHVMYPHPIEAKNLDDW